MMGQICDLETVEPQEIPQRLRNVLECIVSLIDYEAGEDKVFFLKLFDLPKCIVLGLLTADGPGSLLFK